MRPKRRGPTVPGAPRSVVASESFPISWEPPSSNGGSQITGYRVYVNGSLFETVGAPSTDTVDTVGAGSVVEVSAINVIGEGRKSPPVIAA